MKSLPIYIFLYVSMFFVGCSKKAIPTHSISDKSVENSSVVSNTNELEFQYTFTEANKQMLFNNIKQSVLLFNKCIELDSTRSMPYYQLANIYYRAGDATSALSYCEKAYNNEKDNEWINRLLIELYRVNNKVESAIGIAEKSLSNNNGSVEFYFTLASLYHDAGKTKQSLEILDDIENKFGISEEVSLSKHQIYAEAGKNEEAENALLQIIELNPNEYRFLGMLAEFYSSIDRNKEAELIYDSLIVSNPDNPYIILSAAEHFQNLKKYDKSKELYSKALLDKDFDLNNKIRTVIGLMTNPDFSINHNEYIGELINQMIDQEGENVKLLTLRADFNIRKNNFSLAENDLIKVLDTDKSNYVIWEQLLFINNMQNDNETLLDYSQQALTYFPDQPNLFLFKGLAEMNLSKYDKAVSSYKSGLKLTVDNRALELQFLTFLGDVYRNMGNNKLSDEYFEKVLEKDPNNMIVLNNYSYYLSLRDEKLDKAEQFSKKTIQQEPNNSTYLDTYAWILFKLNKYNDAKKYIEKAIENNGSSNSEILGHYGDILVKLKDYKNAVKYWKLAIDNGGDKMVIQKKIDNALPHVKEK